MLFFYEWSTFRVDFFGYCLFVPWIDFFHLGIVVFFWSGWGDLELEPSHRVSCVGRTSGYGDCVATLLKLVVLFFLPVPPLASRCRWLYAVHHPMAVTIMNKYNE
jgi:hypothetical protein